MESYRQTTPNNATSEVELSENTSASKHYKLPLVIILAGVLFSLFLQWHIQDELFFSGDGALKALLAKQFSAGNFRFDLELRPDSWVRDLWNQGLYPFEPPFAYKISNLYYITFPFTFPLVTAPFYALLGFRGLYVVPLVATWSIWVGFYLVCRNFKLGSTITSIAIAALIFASPLTMYSSMYWEHTLAVALAFNGLAILLVRGASEISTRDAVLSGILIGLSVWFREEILCFVVIILALVAASEKLNLGQLNLSADKKLALIISMILTILLIFIINAIVYNNPLGIHALQVVDKISLSDRVKKGYEIFRIMTEELFKYFPVMYLCVIYTFVALVYRKVIGLTPVLKKLLIICAAFPALVSLILPSDGGKQWGARFLLIIIPFICLYAAIALHKAWKIKKFGVRYISLILFAICLGIGVHINSYLGTIDCYPKGETATLTALKFLKEDKNKVVATPNQYVNQTFEVLFDKKAFFLTKKSEDLKKLGLGLQKQGEQKFTYICPSYDRCDSSEPKNIEFLMGEKPMKIEFLKVKEISREPEKVVLAGKLGKKIGKFEKYKIYEASVVEGSVKS